MKLVDPSMELSALGRMKKKLTRRDMGSNPADESIELQGP